MRCVETDFNGSPHGWYCLLDQSTLTGACPKQYAAAHPDVSRNGVSATYCFPLESKTTCEAVLDFKDPCTEMADNDACGVVGLEDGRCRNDGSDFLCTYPCSANADCDGNCNTTDAGDKYCCTGTVPEVCN